MKTATEQKWSAFLDNLCAKLKAKSAKVKSSPVYWLQFHEGLYCEKCIRRFRNWSGGPNWGSYESDIRRYCEKCNAILDVALTKYGVLDEVEYLEDEMKITPEDAFVLLNMIDCGVPRLTERCGDFEYMPELKPFLRKIARRMK